MILDAPRADEFPLIFDAWANSFRKSPWAGCVPNHLWDTVSRAAATEIIDRGATVLVAVTPIEGRDDSERRVMGYVVAEPKRRLLHWLFVKKDYRGAGVGRTLLRAVEAIGPAGGWEYTHRTRASAQFLGDRYRWSPHLARVKS